jgi:AcrR family transcriptional regulator
MPARVAALRPRELSSEATRRAILDAAGELLASRGEAGLSIREVCARAGVTPPTLYHHFGDKAALVDRIVEDCFTEFDREAAKRTPPADPVEALRWAADGYLRYGIAHPTHYRLMFQERPARPSAAGLASYDRLRRLVAAIAAVGRLGPPVEDATAAFWCALHGITSLAIAGFIEADAPSVALVRDAMIAQLTREAPARRSRSRKGTRR